MLLGNDKIKDINVMKLTYLTKALIL